MRHIGAVAGALLTILSSGYGYSADSPGWLVTTYYTAVESLHGGAPKRVTGCLQLDCEDGHSDLGSYPADFVRAVHDEGAGRITSGGFAGEYLNWSAGVGYWIDTAARAADGHLLQPFRSAAADGLAKGTVVRLINCGHTDNGKPPSPKVCDALSAPTWVISDEFTPGAGGNYHVDLYIGEETMPGIDHDPLYTTLRDAELRVG